MTDTAPTTPETTTPKPKAETSPAYVSKLATEKATRAALARAVAVHCGLAAYNDANTNQEAYFPHTSTDPCVGNESDHLTWYIRRHYNQTFRWCEDIKHIVDHVDYDDAKKRKLLIDLYEVITGVPYRYEKRFLWTIVEQILLLHVFHAHNSFVNPKYYPPRHV